MTLELIVPSTEITLGALPTQLRGNWMQHLLAEDFLWEHQLKASPGFCFVPRGGFFSCSNISSTDFQGSHRAGRGKTRQAASKSSV